MRTFWTIIASTLSLCCVADASSRPDLASTPRDYVLFSRTENGRKVPGFVVRVNTVVYPANTSWREFETNGVPRTPEEAAARFVELIQAPNADPDAFLALYAPATRASEKKMKELRSNYLHLRAKASQLNSLRFKRRFDFGHFSDMDADFPGLGTPSASNQEPLEWLLVFYLMAATSQRIGDRAYLCETGAAGDAEEVGWLAYHKALGNALASLPFSVRLPNDSPATENVHPVDVFFDGETMDVPLDGKTRTASPTVNFLQHAA